jgi:hypothetical protein
MADGEEVRLMRWEARLVAFAAACSLVGVVSLGGDRALAASPTQITESSAVNTVADAINTFGSQAYPSSFAGMQAVNAQNITIYLASRDLDFLTRVSESVGRDIQVKYVFVHHSLKQLLAVEQDIAIRDQAALKRDGVNVAMVTPDFARNWVAITLVTPARTIHDYVARAQTILQARYGAPMVFVKPSTMLPATTTGRFNDSAPYYGGDQIGRTETGGNFCTSGFAVFNPHTKTSGVLTAGHCFATGATVVISCDTGSCSGSGNLVGKVGTRLYPPLGGDHDIEFVSGNSIGAVWGGSPTSPKVFDVAGTVEPALGTDMTIDGAVTGERQGQLVTEYDTCAVFDTGWTACDLGGATGSSPPCQGGDSGGPAYVHSGSTVEAAGTINGVNGDTCLFTDAIVAEQDLGVNIDT